MNNCIHPFREWKLTAVTEVKMSYLRKFFVIVVMLILFAHASNRNAEALDLTGAWASDGDKCSKVFALKAGKITFSKDSEIYGAGFIVDGKQITGKSTRCNIKARKDDGPNVNLIAVCASDIMLSNVQLSAKQLDANTIVRLFPGMEGMEVRYFRCPFP